MHHPAYGPNVTHWTPDRGYATRRDKEFCLFFCRFFVFYLSASLPRCELESSLCWKRWLWKQQMVDWCLTRLDFQSNRLLNRAFSTFSTFPWKHHPLRINHLYSYVLIINICPQWMRNRTENAVKRQQLSMNQFENKLIIIETNHWPNCIQTLHWLPSITFSVPINTFKISSIHKSLVSFERYSKKHI